MSDFDIALYIVGTRIRHGGMGYILSVGGLAGNENEGEIDMPPISRAVTKENPVITIKNAENYVYYKLWDSSIAPSDDENNPGRLAICMTMSSNVRLKNGKSPYNLLMDIYQKFLELGTAHTNGGQRVFLNVDLGKGDFEKIINSYPLERVRVRVEPMKGTTIAEIQVPVEKMEDFFRDTQYPEFANYKAVEVTTKGNNIFPGLEIPRPVSYEVFLDGDPTGFFMQKSYDNYTAKKDNTEDERYDSLYFTLGELLQKDDYTKSNRDGTVVVKLDKLRRRIDCTLKAKPILYSWKYRFSHDSDSDAINFVQKGRKNNTIRIKLNGNDLNTDDPLQASRAKAIKKDQIDIYPHETEGFILSVHKVELDYDYKDVVIVIKAKTNVGKEDDIKTGHGKRDDNHNIMDFIIGGVIGLALGVGGTLGTQKILDIVGYKNGTKEESSAYKKAHDSSDTLVMKFYLQNYSNPQFEYPNQQHLTVIQEKLNLARMEAEAASKAAKAEAELYSKCKDENKLLDERIKACEDYLKEEYKSKNEISKLKTELEKQRENANNAEAERAAFKACKDAQKQPYPKNYEACQTYKNGGYSNETNGTAVEGYIQTIMKGRDDILDRLNLERTVDSKYGSDKWKKYITEEEYKAITNILNPNFGTPIRNNNVKTYIKDEFGFPDNKKFSNFQEVIDLFKVLKTIE